MSSSSILPTGHGIVARMSAAECKQIEPHYRCQACSTGWAYYETFGMCWWAREDPPPE